MTTLALKFFFDEDGRIGRIGYVVGLGLVVIFMVIAIASIRLLPNEPTQGILGFIFVVAAFLAFRSLTTRRCHDFGKTIWSSFWRDQIPIIGPIWACVEMIFKPGDTEGNEYGDVPRF